MTDLGSYLLGLATLPGIVVIVAAAVWVVGLFMRSPRTGGHCDVCDDAGLRQPEYREWETRIGYWLRDVRHRFRARLNPRHRNAWEAWYHRRGPEYIDGHWPKARRRYGRAPKKS